MARLPGQKIKWHEGQGRSCVPHTTNAGAGKMATRIIWLRGKENAGSSSRERAAIRGWINAHGDEFHAIYHFSEGNDVETTKIIQGDQEIGSSGKITIRTLELRFLKGVVLAVRALEEQDPGSPAMRRTATQLGYIEPSCNNGCCAGAIQIKKEIN